MERTATPSEPQHNEPRPRGSRELSSILLEQCQNLLSELSAFQAYLITLGKPNLVELRQFKSIVQSELKSLQRLATKAEEAIAEDWETSRRILEARVAEEREENADREADEYGGLGEAELKVLHSLRSSNFPFYANVWRIAKTTCTGLTALNKKFYFYQTRRNRAMGADPECLATTMRDTDTQDCSEPEAKSSTLRKRGILIDIVADNGEEWVKVSTVTPNRLLFDLAKQGWEIGLDSDSENDNDSRSRTSSTPNIYDYDSEDDDDMIELLKLAVDMKKAAAEVRVRYRHPRVRLVLPKIVEGQVNEIDMIIRKVRKTGVTVECATSATPSFDFEIDGYMPFEAHDAPALFSTLLPNPFPHMTPTLNVDCTLLLAFVSDLSHTRNIQCSPSYHPAINRQIEFEAEKQLLPTELWPSTGDRDLVCTLRAAKRMQEIVDTIGTPDEKERTRILMGDVVDASDRQSLISRFQKLSDYEVPPDWKLPIKVVDSQKDIERGWKDGSLPFLARGIAQKLSDINRSVFLYGWAAGLTTISSNRTVIKQIEVWIEEQRGDDDEVCGPTVWVCDTARSLIGKDSNRAI